MKFQLSNLCIAIVCILICMSCVPRMHESECETVEGMVTHIFEAGEYDICFRLKDHKSIFYINRGIEQGLDLETLRSTLISEKVIIKYPEYWSPLDPNKYSIHLAKLTHDSQIIYDETLQ